MDFFNYSISDFITMTSDDKNYIRSNKLRGEVFKNSFNKLKVSLDLLEEYERFLQESFKKVLRLQLGVRKRTGGYDFYKVGIASKALYNSVDAEASVSMSRSVEKGTIDIAYTIQGKYDQQGDYISKPRVPERISIDALIRWIKNKQKLNVFKILPRKTKKAKNADNGEGSIIAAKAASDAVVTRVAWAIARKANKNPRIAILENWASYSKNARLRRQFDLEVKKTGAKYRAKMRRDIIKNMNS